ncbi:tRNA/tmRNA (uracil-C(5))-methyltransferase [Azospira sp. I13]|uniref:tRNA (uridine(54)-C5)-methyltransferase TrmA n=1 Tax=Azospira sp. I13 TaxID=1765050 RepID=UPI000D46C026|nr:tRNA (uridine(54)-C5)-methyltransferase TrmA [Azospira sp. I13]GBG02802.1 tRNA/tmRNA (uracil-C(5))-methyltransferase [Azospira sp. I13]
MPLRRFAPDDYDTLLAAKVAHFREEFAAFDLPEPHVAPSAPRHYRLRAEFQIIRHEGKVAYAMFNPDNTRQAVPMATFPVASDTICAMMPRLQAELQASDLLKDFLFRVDFLSTLSGDLLVTLVYKRPLRPLWEEAARGLAERLGIQLIGRSRGQKVVLGRDWVEEAFELEGRALRYKQIEGGFTQPNGEVNRQMLAWACARAQEIAPAGESDLLELYCGNGNFTIALAPHYSRVLATEMSKTSVYAALDNLAANQVSNVQMLRLSSEEFTEAYVQGKEFTRLAGIDLKSYRFSTVFVDPPRAGLDDGTLELVRGFDNILYISCNPETLKANVAALHNTHRIAAAAAFDQFPYTDHLECGLLLSRR